MTQFDEYVQRADLVITGEGAIDGQTVYGKTPVGVAKAAKSMESLLLRLPANWA